MQTVQALQYAGINTSEAARLGERLKISGSKISYSDILVHAAECAAEKYQAQTPEFIEHLKILIENPCLMLAAKPFTEA
jgi:hypothetical protein